MTIIRYFQRRSRLTWSLVFLGLFVTLTSSLLDRKTVDMAQSDIRITPMKDGGKMISEAAIQGILDANMPKSNDLGQLSKLESILSEHPNIEKADVFINAQGNMVVKIAQPEILLRVIDSRGANYFISRSGHKIPGSKYHVPRVPIFTGKIPLFHDSLIHQPGHLFYNMHALATAIETDDFMDAITEQIDCDSHGFTIVPKMGKFRFVFGGIDRMEAKLRNMKVFYERILPIAGWDKYKEVDLRFKNQVVGRKD